MNNTSNNMNMNKKKKKNKKKKLNRNKENNQYPLHNRLQYSRIYKYIRSIFNSLVIPVYRIPYYTQTARRMLTLLNIKYAYS